MITQSNNPIPKCAQISTFRHRGTNYEIAVWRRCPQNCLVHNTWAWASAGHSAVSPSSADAMSSAREWIKNGVHGAQRA